MKNMTLRRMAVLAVAGSLAGVPLMAADPGSGSAVTHREWTFDSGANPATGELSEQAVITPGAFSLGWQQQRPGLGDTSGFWDLGRSGKISVSLKQPASLAARQITVQVWQWMDGGIYSEFAKVSLPGAAPVLSDARDATLEIVGGWMIDKSVWQVPSGVNANAILLEGAYDGSLIDKITVDTASVVPEPILLSIERSPGTNRIQISWPVGVGPATLESSANLGDPRAWTSVPIDPQVNGDHYTVTMDVSETGQFFRLRKPMQ